MVAAMYLDINVLLEKIDLLRQQSKRIVFTNGCFDILHKGHVSLLCSAKEKGDVLIVAINTDDSVRRQNKGKDRPIVPLEARAYVVANLASVDYVVAFDEDTPYSLIQQIKPDVLVKGGDWAMESIVGADFVMSYGGSVVRIPLEKGFSTTAIIQKIRSTA